MKRFLRVILDFLERKFPDQMVVTLKDYNDLSAHISSIGLEMKASLERIQELEKREKEFLDLIKKMQAEITKFNASLGFDGMNARLKLSPFER